MIVVGSAFCVVDGEREECTRYGKIGRSCMRIDQRYMRIG
jgi:hypothetical protein